MLTSPYIVPIAGVLAGITWIGFTSWRKVREQELNHEREMRQKEMDHEQKMKEMELERVRQKDKQ